MSEPFGYYIESEYYGSDLYFRLRSWFEEQLGDEDSLAQQMLTVGTTMADHIGIRDALQHTFIIKLIKDTYSFEICIKIIKH